MSQLGTLPPGLPAPGVGSWTAWASAMIRSLTQVFGGIMQDLSQQPKCPEFLTADIPAAGDWKGRIIFVSDAAAGARFQGSTGAAWVNLG